MALESGTRFGSYEVVEAIGAGGMGEVYRAHDTTLERDVAIKVLPASFAEDQGRVERFEREAKTLASLNHPNIAQIYGLEKSNSTTALVMELVDGSTLAERIAKGPIPADEALGIAMQIADALEAAHGQNIVHRDLKPANIKLRPDGIVKILDFGIAKALAPENLTSGPQSPIMTTPATQVGVILGTAAYMSPEQAKGKAVDQRTDIWAFGCVLYEMLTGQLAFGAEDVPTTLARVIDRDTNLDSLPAAVAPSVRHALTLCLQKDVSRRLADIRDVRLALSGALELQSSHPTEMASARPIGRTAVSVTAAVVITGVIVASTMWLATRPAPLTVTRFDYDLPDGQLFRAPGWPMIAIAADGSHFVYNTQDGLYLRAMDQIEARLIQGTETGMDNPTLSPDGQTVAYWALGNQLRRISVTGGAPVKITDTSAGLFGASWEADGTILYAERDGIRRVSANGGAAELVIRLPKEPVTRIHGPSLLPDGDAVLFSVTSQATGWDESYVVAQSLSTGERTVLIEGGSDARYLSTGHLVYAFGDVLFAIAFDPDTLAVSGGALPLVQGVLRSTTDATGVAHYDVSENGTLTYVSGAVAPVVRSLTWVDREGREVPLGAPLRTYSNVRISPDQTRLALDIRDQDRDIWIWDLVREGLSRLTFDTAEDEFPVWSPDSRQIAFSRTRTGDASLYWRAADGSGSEVRLAEGNGQMFSTSFLPDAEGILVFGTGSNVGTGDDVGLFRFGGDGEATTLLGTTFEESYPAVSPDGNWLAYVSDESGREEIYVRPFPDVNSGRWQVSTGGGTQPLWSREGREVVYRSGESVVAVPVETDPSFRAGSPEMLFAGSYFLGNGGPNYDVTPDGERFLMIKEVESSVETPKIIVVENWFEELKRLVPTE